MFLQIAGAFNYHHENMGKVAGSILCNFRDVHKKWPTYGEDLRSNYLQRIGYHKITSMKTLSKLGSKVWEE